MPSILYVVTSADRGGAQHYVLALAKHFSATIAVGTEASWLFDEAKKQGIRTIPVQHLKRSINPYHDLLALYELRRIMRAEKPDIVHLNSTKAGVIGSFAAYKAASSKLQAPRSSPAIIYTVHGAVFNEKLNLFKSRLYRYLERKAARLRSFTITVSRADYAAMQANGGLKEGTMSVIHNGVEQIDFLGRQVARQQLGLPAEGLIIGTVANYYANKGLDLLIKAIAQMPPESLAKISSVVLMGDGPEREKLERLVKTHELQKIIKFVQNEANASRLLKAFDIFVLPSRKEGMPFALLEALQARLPIVATKVGGVAEVLGDAGVLVESENPTTLAKAISSVVENRAERERLSSLAQTQAEKFSLVKMLEETEHVYDSVRGR